MDSGEGELSREDCLKSSGGSELEQENPFLVKGLSSEVDWNKPLSGMVDEFSDDLDSLSRRK